MEYGLTKKEPLSKHLNCMMCDELDAVLRLAKDPSVDTQQKVHECRKHLKKARSVVRMIKPAIPKSTWMLLMPALRNAGKALGELRELDAHLECLVLLQEKIDEAAAKESLRAVYKRLEKVYASDLTQTEDCLQKSEANATAARILLEECNFKAVIIDILQGGIFRSYCCCRRLHRSLSPDSPIKDLHEWRKRAKDLRYQIAVVADAWPAMLNTLESELHVLTDHLGHIHDLALLMELLEDVENNKLPASDCAVVIPLLQQQCNQELSGAFNLGALLFAEKPNCFRKRIGHYLASGE